MSDSPAPQGVQITASKVHVPFKTELLNEISSPRFAGRAPHLVGILATDKEDARTYAEVCHPDLHIDPRILTSSFGRPLMVVYQEGL